MLAANNLLKPSDGKPVCVPTQDMVLGSYYLTLVKPEEKGTGKVFRDRNEAMMAYDDGAIELHAPIKVRYFGKNAEGESISRLVDTTVGYIIFNDSIPQDLGFVDRTVEGHELDLEISFSFDEQGNPVAKKISKSMLGKIIDRCIKVHGTTVTSEVLDKIKATGYHYSTIGSITVAVCDALIPPAKKQLIADAEENIDKISKDFKRGLISDDERHRLVIEIWDKTTNDVMTALKDNLDEYNPIYMMADSGARGSMNQIRQLAGMRGLIANTSGRTIETPIRANYREGLNILEYFISSRGARKGLADTALRTADSGYLTRRLVDVSQDVIIREDDCGSKVGIEVYDIKEGKHVIEPLSERLVGRYLIEDLYDKDGNLLMDNQHMMTDEDADRIVKAGIERVKIRSVLNCRAKHGVCKKCYGANLANGKQVSTGEAVGIVAAQSIGEPGTQLTMRTFHTGGIASAEDITQGLPRVEELFEARKPKRTGIISEIAGRVRIEDVKRNREVVVTDEKSADERKYTIPYGYRIIVNEGDFIEKGTPITEGVLNPHDVLAVNGVEAVQDYIIAQVQSVYRLQGVDINDKHIEVIVRQMMKKLRVTDAGDTGLLAGVLTERNKVYIANDEIRERNERGEKNAFGEPLREAQYDPVLLGICKAALASDSFLSAASFQETAKVLTDAAIKGKIDPLEGLKENVIIGNLVPSGTGMRGAYVDEEGDGLHATIGDAFAAQIEAEELEAEKYQDE